MSFCDTEVSNEGTAGRASIVDTSDESTLLSALSYPYNESAADDRHLAEGKSDVWKWSTSRSGSDRLLTLTKLTGGGTARAHYRHLAAVRLSLVELALVAGRRGFRCCRVLVDARELHPYLPSRTSSRRRWRRAQIPNSIRQR